ncbi:MAG: pitrilysin family protein [Flaviflexus sp.]|nr:pitrilysin family protein [Flaviflexus sp.]
MYDQLHLTEELTAEEDGRVLRRTIHHGIRVLTENIPTQRSVALGLWIGAGSRDEEEGAYGSTHFLEHLLFKGTRERSAQDIAQEIDFLGGDINAMTSKQFTCYHGRVFDEDLPRAVSLLADMVASATFTKKDMGLERGVILDELAMYADDPAEVASEQLPIATFGDHPIARPVGGTPQSVADLAYEALAEHYATHYRPPELVITAAGSVDHDHLVRLVLEALSRHWDLTDEEPVARPVHEQVGYEMTERILRRPAEQAAVAIGLPGFAYGDPRRPALLAAMTILGSGSSARLFQEIREKRGLAYTTYAYTSSFGGGGMSAMVAQTKPVQAYRVASLMTETLENLASGGPTPLEVESAYRRLRAGAVFDAESLQQRMMRLGVAELISGKLFSLDELLRRQREVRREDICEMLNLLASGPRSLVMVGPVE